MIVKQKSYHEMLGDCFNVIETKFEVGDTIWYVEKRKYAKVVKSAKVLYMQTYKDGYTFFGCIDETRRRGDIVIPVYIGDIFSSEKDALKWLELDKERNSLVQERNFDRRYFINISKKMNELHGGDSHWEKIEN